MATAMRSRSFLQIKITHIVDFKGDPRVAFDSATQIIGQEKKERTDAFAAWRRFPERKSPRCSTTTA